MRLDCQMVGNGKADVIGEKIVHSAETGKFIPTKVNESYPN